MRYITALKILLLVLTTVQVVPYLGAGSVHHALPGLLILLTSGSFHGLFLKKRQKKRATGKFSFKLIKLTVMSYPEL